MIIQKFDIDNYWNVIVYYEKPLEEDIMGYTQTDFDKKLSIIAIGKGQSKKEMMNTLVHEAKHLQSHICKYYNVPEDGENAAYLIGYIISKMYKIFHYLICC